MQHLEGSQRCSQPAACSQLEPAAAAASPRPVESCSSKSAAAPQHTPAAAGEELPALQSAPWHRDRAAGPGTKCAAVAEPPCASAASSPAALTPAEQLPPLPPDSPPPPLPPDSPPPPLPLDSPPPPLPPDSPPPQLPADSPPPTLPPLPSSPPTTAAGRAAARGAATSRNAEGGGCPAAAPQREAAAAEPRAAAPLPTPKKSLVPAFLLEMWQALSPRKAQRGSQGGEAAAGAAAGLSRLGVRPTTPAAPVPSAAAAAMPAGTRASDAKGSINSTAASAGTSTQQDLVKANPHQAAAGREAAAPAAPAAPVAEPAEEELEDGEILLSPASRAALVCSSADSAATAAAGVAVAPPALGPRPAGSPAALVLVRGPSRTFSSRSPLPAGRLPEERGGGGSKAKGVGKGVVAALRRTLRGKKRRSKKEKEAARCGWVGGWAALVCVRGHGAGAVVPPVRCFANGLCGLGVGFECMCIVGQGSACSTKMQGSMGMEAQVTGAVFSH